MPQNCRYDEKTWNEVIQCFISTCTFFVAMNASKLKIHRVYIQQIPCKWLHDMENRVMCILNLSPIAWNVIHDALRGSGKPSLPSCFPSLLVFVEVEYQLEWKSRLSLQNMNKTFHKSSGADDSEIHKVFLGKREKSDKMIENAKDKFLKRGTNYFFNVFWFSDLCRV